MSYSEEYGRSRLQQSPLLKLLSTPLVSKSLKSEELNFQALDPQSYRQIKNAVAEIILIISEQQPVELSSICDVIAAEAGVMKTIGLEAICDYVEESFIQESLEEPEEEDPSEEEEDTEGEEDNLIEFEPLIEEEPSKESET